MRTGCGQLMSSYIVIALDATGPDIEIIAPQYTSPNIFTEIRIQANELLAKWQEVYIIDSAGMRHDLIFEHTGDCLVGEVVLNFCALGLVTIYAQVKDEVLNPSPLVSKTFNLMETVKVFVEMDIKQRVMAHSARMRDIAWDGKVRDAPCFNHVRGITEISRARDMTIKADGKVT